MRFRQIYPMFTRKTNRRILNLADTSSDNSSSDEEPPNSSSNRHVRRNSEPASSGGVPPPNRDGNSATPNVSSTNASSSNPNVASGTATGSGGSTVRNFNTELEQLVTTLLNEIERNEGDNGRSTGGSTNSNGTTQTSRSNSTTNSKYNANIQRSEKVTVLQACKSNIGRTYTLIHIIV